MDIRIFLGAIGLYLVLLAYMLVRALRKGRARFELKKSVNHLRFSVHLIWVTYFSVWAVNQMLEVVAWTANYMWKYNSGTLTYYVVAAAPYVFIITAFAITMWVMLLSGKPWIRYSEQEQEWLKEEKEQFREKLQRWFGRRVASLVK